MLRLAIAWIDASLVCPFLVDSEMSTRILWLATFQTVKIDRTGASWEWASLVEIESRTHFSEAFQAMTIAWAGASQEYELFAWKVVVVSVSLLSVRLEGKVVA
jgi:hypothetical protein